MARRVVAYDEAEVAAWFEIYRCDLETGAFTPVDLPAYPTGAFRLADGGKTLVYAVKGGYYRVDLVSGASTFTEVSSPGRYGSVIDQSGRYVVRLRYEDNDAILERQQIGSAAVEPIRTFKGVGESILLTDASDNRVLLTTGLKLSPSETTFGSDVYFVDVATGELSLASQGPDGKPVDDLPISPKAALLSPGGEAVYVSQRKDLTNPNLPDWKYPYWVAYRQGPGELPKPLVKAVTAGGSHIAPYVDSFTYRAGYSISRNDHFALVLTVVPGQDAGRRLLLRDLRTNADSKVIVDDPALKPAPLDVTFDDRYAAYFRLDASGGNSRLYAYDTVENRERWATRTLGTDNVPTYARFDTGGRLYFIADAAGLPSGETGNWLFRYDPASDLLTPLQAVSDNVGGYVSVGSGWVAYFGAKDSKPRVTVVNSATGKTAVVLSVRLGSRLDNATITSDGKRIAIPWVDVNGIENGTALYDLPTGTELPGNLPNGKLTPDGLWLLSYYRDIYLPTGATIDTDSRFAAIGGRGPEVFYGAQNGGMSSNSPTSATNDRGLDVYRYSIGIPTSPALYDTAVATGRGRLSISAMALEAGLRKAAKTWIEYQIDGGEWRGIPQPDGNNLPRTAPIVEGSHIVGLRARDSLGRTSEIQTFPVKVDTTKPVVSQASAKVEGTSVTVRFTLSEYAGVRFVYSTGGVKEYQNIDALPAGTYERVLTGLIAGKTYTLQVQAIDAVSNSGVSKTLTITTGS